MSSAEVAEHYQIGVVGAGASYGHPLSIWGECKGFDGERFGIEMCDLSRLAAVERLVKQIGADASGEIEHQPASVGRPAVALVRSRGGQRLVRLSAVDAVDDELVLLFAATSHSLQIHDLFAIRGDLGSAERIAGHLLR